MQHPELLVIPGDDLIQIEQDLNTLNVKYTICHKSVEKETRLYIKEYVWPDKPFIYLDDIYVGLQLPFFKSIPVELEWNIANCIPQSWCFDNWETNMFKDVDFWFSARAAFKVTKADKAIMTDIVNNRIYEETETLKKYNDILAVFLHPEIHTVLEICSLRKESHIEMWCNIKEKLDLLSQKPKFIKFKDIAITLEDAANNLIEIVTIEEILEPAATECLSRFTLKNHLCQFIKVVQRRDKESRENAQVLKTLLDEFEKIYPFLKDTINNIYITNQTNENDKNNHLKMFQFVNQ